jgi:hypothetical protein
VLKDSNPTPAKTTREQSQISDRLPTGIAMGLSTSGTQVSGSLRKYQVTKMSTTYIPSTAVLGQTLGDFTQVPGWCRVHRSLEPKSYYKDIRVYCQQEHLRLVSTCLASCGIPVSGRRLCVYPFLMNITNKERRICQAMAWSITSA